VPGEAQDHGEEPGVLSVYGKDPSGVPWQTVAPLDALQDTSTFSPALTVPGSMVSEVTGKQEGEAAQLA